MDYTKKRVKIIFTGGTIAGNVAQSDERENVKTGADSFLSMMEGTLATFKKNWNMDIELSVTEAYNIDSSKVTAKHWAQLIDIIRDSYDQADSFIILHGTNTMGYTSAALSFALGSIGKPVIITGAQVPSGYLGTDATTNLINSLRVAVWPYNELKGVFAVFGSKIITGTRVKKGTDFDYDPFSSFQSGSIGQIGRYIKIDEGALNKHLAYLEKADSDTELGVHKIFSTEKIASFTEFPGMSPEVIKTLVDNYDIKGIVFRSFGAGDPSDKLFEAFEYLKAKQIPIIVTTQAPGGVSNFQVNETGQYLREHDLAIPAHDMSIESMTAKMAWLIGQELDYETIKAKMVEDLHGEIHVGAELI